jgi:hypothetical protein
MMKPTAEDNGNGWHRVQIEAVAYSLNRLLGMDYVPPCIFRTNAECDWQCWPASVFMYWAEGGKELHKVGLGRTVCAWGDLRHCVYASTPKRCFLLAPHG